MRRDGVKTFNDCNISMNVIGRANGWRVVATSRVREDFL